MILPKEQVELAEGKELRGRFWIAGRPDTSVAGVLHWSRSEGAQLWLIGPFTGWPGTGFSSGSSEPPLTVHGISAANGKKVTLPAGLITHSTFGSGSQLKLVDPRLILFEHLEPADTWKKLVLRSASLHEWLPVTGFEAPAAEFDKRFQIQDYSIRWKAPRGKRVQLSDAEIRFSSRMSTNPSRWQPDRLIQTAMDAVVVAKSRDTLDSLHERFAIPLLDLLILATGRPDTVTYEAVLRGARTHAVVLQRGPGFTPREWRPWQPPLFYAGQLPDFRAAVKKWFELHSRVSPAIEVFTDSINQGAVYSPSRLLSVASALETYHRVLYEAAWKRRWRQSNPGKKTPTPSLLQRIEHLQRIAGVTEAATGLSQANRQLLVSSRNHFAHLSAPHYGYTVEDVYDNALATIRRGVTLMQACLMRRLGFSGRRTQDRLAEHYRNWRIPP